jgi:CheY-like chemotaxis protein
MTACIEGELKTILHAEDDDLVRKLMAKNLSRLGYRLISAVDGQDAVAQFITHREEIRLLLLDLIMPRMNGLETFNEIRKLQPEIKAIFCSACPEVIFRARDRLNEEVTIFTKPVNMNQLAGKIQELLG